MLEGTMLEARILGIYHVLTLESLKYFYNVRTKKKKKSKKKHQRYLNI